MMEIAYDSLLTLESANLSFAVDGDVQAVLQDINLSLHAGQFDAIVGANASGKSTLARVAAGLLPLSSGQRSLADNARIGMVLQRPMQQLLGSTAREDLYAIMESASLSSQIWEMQMEDSLHRVGLSIDPDQPIKQLSGGQQQLLAIAGCLAVGATVLVLDEPTSMLDPGHQQLVLERVHHLCREGAAVLWVTHRLEELAYADRVHCTEQGRMVYSGTPRHFFYGVASTFPGPASAARASCPCAELGFPLPYTAAVVRHLREDGIILDPLPLTVTSLAEAVASYA